jgi:hypothetical protein
MIRRYFSLKNNIMVVFLAASLFTACRKDLLETLPTDRISTEIFWKTENDAKLASNGIYTYLDGLNLFAWDGITDIGHTNQLFQTEAIVEQGIFDALNSRIANEWSNAYTGIHAANYFLENVDKVPTTNTTFINQLKGEAKTLRAYFYIKLAGLYGAVPLVTKSISISEGRSLTRNTTVEIWNFIDKELTDASALLPANYGAR